MLHAAAAQHGHSQEETQHQTIQGYTHHLFTDVVFKPSLSNSKRIINQDWVVLLPISFDLCVIDW